MRERFGEKLQFLKNNIASGFDFLEEKWRERFAENWRFSKLNIRFLKDKWGARFAEIMINWLFSKLENEFGLTCWYKNEGNDLDKIDHFGNGILNLVWFVFEHGWHFQIHGLS